MYYILHKDNKLVGVSNTIDSTMLSLEGVSFEIIDEDIPNLNTSTFDPETFRMVSTSHEFTKLEFLTRFTLTERLAIDTSTDPIVIDIMKLFDAAEFICTDDLTTQQGVGYLAQIGILTPERYNEILMK